MMHTRYDELRASGSGRDVNVTLNPMARGLWGDSDTANAQRVIEAERELLRRWKAGDSAAKLPKFDTVAAPAKPAP